MVFLFLVLFFCNCSYVTHGITSILANSYPGAIYHFETKEKLVALTIDDAPDSNTTPEIIEVLEKYNAKATFFIITSYIENNESLVKEIVAGGHELGNHMPFDEPSIKLEQSEFIAKFNQADSILSQFDTVQWFRPGSGWYSEKMIDFLERDQRGYKCVLGSVYPFDAAIPASSFAVNWILFNVQPGSIIILHDGENRGRRTAETLKRVLPKLKERGYKVVTLSEIYKRTECKKKEF